MTIPGDHGPRPLTRKQALDEESGIDAASEQSLPGPTPPPEESGAGETAWARLKAALSPSISRSQLLAAVLCALLGFAIVAQVRQTEEDGLAQLSETDLVRVLDDVSGRADRLEAEAEELRGQRDELRSGSDAREAARTQAEERLEDLTVLAGTAPVTGPGIVVTVDDPDGQVSASDMVTFVQELRDAGAEAIQINDSRVVASTALTQSENGIAVDGAEYADRYRIIAIGDPDTMATAMKIPGGVADVVARRGGSASINNYTKVDIDAVAPE